MVLTSTGTFRGTAIVALIQRGVVVLASDTKVTSDDDPFFHGRTRKVMEYPDLLVAAAGISKSTDTSVEPHAVVRAQYRPGIGLKELSQAVQRAITTALEDLLTRRRRDFPERYAKTYPTGAGAVQLLFCRNQSGRVEVAMFQLIPVKPKGRDGKVQVRPAWFDSINPTEIFRFAIGDGGSGAILTAEQQKRALETRDTVFAAQCMIRNAILAKPSTVGPPIETWEYQPGFYRQLADVV